MLISNESMHVFGGDVKWKKQTKTLLKSEKNWSEKRRSKISSAIDYITFFFIRCEKVEIHFLFVLCIYSQEKNVLNFIYM